MWALIAMSSVHLWEPEDRCPAFLFKTHHSSHSLVAKSVTLEKISYSTKFDKKEFFWHEQKGKQKSAALVSVVKNLWFWDENLHKEHIGETEPGFLGSPLDLLHILYQPSGDKSGELTIENISLFKIESLIEGEAWSWTPVGCGTKAWWLGNQVEQFKHQTIKL